MQSDENWASVALIEGHGGPALQMIREAPRR